jgi:hypothetical protein
MVGQPPLKRPAAGSIPAWGTTFAAAARMDVPEGMPEAVGWYIDEG